MTHEEMLAALRDIRLPATAEGGLLAECLVAIGIGLLIAYALHMLIRPFIGSRKSDVPPETIGDRITRLRSAPPQDRAVALLHLVRQHNQDAYHHLKGDLYRRNGTPTDFQKLEAALDPAQVVHG